MEDGYYALSFDDADSKSPTIERRGDYDIEPFTNYSDPENDYATDARHSISAQKKGLMVKKHVCINKTRTLDPTDHYDTKIALYNWCDNGYKIGRLQVMVGVKNTVVYWVCNHIGTKLSINPRTPCSQKELVEVEWIFNQTCGEDKGAWVMLSTKKSIGRAARPYKIKCGDGFVQGP